MCLRFDLTFIFTTSPVCAFKMGAVGDYFYQNHPIIKVRGTKSALNRTIVFILFCLSHGCRGQELHGLFQNAFATPSSYPSSELSGSDPNRDPSSQPSSELSGSDPNRDPSSQPSYEYDAHASEMPSPNPSS